jgi:hypothetical protein
MKVRKGLLAAALTVATMGAGAIGVGAAEAAQSTPSTGPMSGLVSAIATKFNLNQNDVQQVFDEQHAKLAAERQQTFVDRINAAVTAGTITQAQADKILAKEQEMKTFMETLQGKTQDERRTAIKNQIQSLKDWAKTNNIPANLLPFGGGGHGRIGRPHMDGEMGMRADQSLR